MSKELRELFATSFNLIFISNRKFDCDHDAPSKLMRMSLNFNVVHLSLSPTELINSSTQTASPSVHHANIQAGCSVADLTSSQSQSLMTSLNFDIVSSVCQTNRSYPCHFESELKQAQVQTVLPVACVSVGSQAESKSSDSSLKRGKIRGSMKKPTLGCWKRHFAHPSTLGYVI